MKGSFIVLVMICVVAFHVVIGLRWADRGTELDEVPGEDSLGPEWRKVDPEVRDPSAPPAEVADW